MEIYAQALPSSSQSPEVAAMEKQVRDLTANLQELNQKLLQHETEKQKEKDKGKSKERGDAESRQEQ